MNPRSHHNLRIALCLGFLLMTSMGFKLIGNKWDISPDKPTIWVKFDAEDLLDGFDYLPGTWDYSWVSFASDEEQRRLLINAIFNDYHKINTSFLRLSFYPIDGLVSESGSSMDTPFSTSEAETKTIHVKVSRDTGGAFTAGYASSTTSGDYFIGCNIVMGESTWQNAQEFVSTLTHELGHCLGLHHNHADTDAIMGYNSTTYKLGIDEQMGITHLYPTKEEYGREAATLGLSCQEQ